MLIRSFSLVYSSKSLSCLLYSIVILIVYMFMGFRIGKSNRIAIALTERSYRIDIALIEEMMSGEFVNSPAWTRLIKQPMLHNGNLRLHNHVVF